tara:strand:+ start:2408 stop:3037 length:630 start_codon:yes stop_codon:yes gene_type:complete
LEGGALDANCFYFNHDQVNNHHPYLSTGKILSDKQCDTIIEGAKDWAAPIIHGTGMQNESYTNTEIGHCYVNEEWIWLYDHLTLAARDLNRTAWQFQVTGTFECIDIIKYTAPGGGMKWHHDLHTGGPSTAARKLNMIVQLSDPDDYEGGELQMFCPGWGNDNDGEIFTVPKDRGIMYVMPTYIYHRVQPVTQGVRHSLVTYCHGHHFQ